MFDHHPNISLVADPNLCLITSSNRFPDWLLAQQLHSTGFLIRQPT
jgi:hypothetical protein